MGIRYQIRLSEEVRKKTIKREKEDETERQQWPDSNSSAGIALQGSAHIYPCVNDYACVFVRSTCCAARIISNSCYRTTSPMSQFENRDFLLLQTTLSFKIKIISNWKNVFFIFAKLIAFNMIKNSKFLWNIKLTLRILVIRDSRCFLENGSTAAHLFVSEDLQIGDTVGVLGVIGDPAAQGDIELRLQELDSPVTISPNSKNLTLTGPLDKEGFVGPSSVYINVICERKHTSDPVSFVPHFINFWKSDFVAISNYYFSISGICYSCKYSRDRC